MPPSSCPGRAGARAAFRGVGLGYLRFARQEPGLFRTACGAALDVHERAAQDDAARGASGMDPFELLCHALDGLVQAGVLPAAQRQAPSSWPGRPCTAWRCCSSTAPCAAWARPQPALAERLVAMVEQGLLAEAAPQ
jgi:hypothetical protein